MYYWIIVAVVLLFFLVLCCCWSCRRKPKPLLPTVAEAQISTADSHGSRDYEDRVLSPWGWISSITPSAPPHQVPQHSHVPWPAPPRKVPQHSHVPWPAPPREVPQHSHIPWPAPPREVPQHSHVPCPAPLPEVPHHSYIPWPTTKYDVLPQIESPTLHLKFGDRSVSEVFKNENGIPTLDLHHMTVQEATETTNSFIKDLDVHQKFKIITGRGLHSEGGIPKVKPVIESLLKKANYEFEEVNNGGCFECKKTRPGGLPVTNHTKKVKQRLHLKQALNKKPTSQTKHPHNQNNPHSKSQISPKTNAMNYKVSANTPSYKTKPPKPKNYSSASRKSQNKTRNTSQKRKTY